MKLEIGTTYEPRSEFFEPVKIVRADMTKCPAWYYGDDGFPYREDGAWLQDATCSPNAKDLVREHKEDRLAMPTKYVDKTGTADKPDPMNFVFLEFPMAMSEVSRVGQFGSKKHARRGWSTFEPDFAIDYHQSKIGRHLIARIHEGDLNPADGDTYHMAAVAWNALAALEQILRKKTGKPSYVSDQT